MVTDPFSRRLQPARTVETGIASPLYLWTDLGTLAKRPSRHAYGWNVTAILASKKHEFRLTVP
jgi:hypothetical protein